MNENTVTYGIKNVHYSKLTFNSDGSRNYGDIKALPGATEISLDAKGDMTEFYADDMLYYSASNNQGYDGKLSLANISEEFGIDILGEEKDEDDEVVTENATAQGSKFALMFEFTGDIKAIRHVMYYCSASRPNLKSQTKSDKSDPNKAELDFKATARPGDYKVKTKTTTTTPANIYNNWYNSVYDKATTPLAVTVSPIDEAAGIAVNSNIVWTFDKVLNEGNINTGNFIIMNSAGIEIAGTLTLDTTKKIVIFNPTADLASNTAYTTIALTTVRGTDGSVMAANNITNFTTGA